jgi:hypothetical protein
VIHHVLLNFRSGSASHRAQILNFPFLPLRLKCNAAVLRQQRPNMPPSLPRSLTRRSSLLPADSIAHQRCLTRSPLASPAGARRYLSSEERAEALADAQKNLRRWLSDAGSRFKRPTGYPTYLRFPGIIKDPPKDRPFPDNPSYQSQPVLSENAKERIWQEVKSGQPIKVVSAKYRVDVRRVAAVVRLREVQENMATEVGLRC